MMIKAATLLLLVTPLPALAQQVVPLQARAAQSVGVLPQARPGANVTQQDIPRQSIRVRPGPGRVQFSGLADYFDYPGMADMLMIDSPVTSFGNDALWEDWDAPATQTAAQASTARTLRR